MFQDGPIIVILFLKPKVYRSTTFDEDRTLQPLKNYVLYSMNVCRMNEIQVRKWVIRYICL